MEIVILCVSCLSVFVGKVIGDRSEYVHVTDFRNAFDKELYARVLDEDKCNRQLNILTNHSLALQFWDASGKLPSGMLMGNVNDPGDYFECLDIKHVINEIDIQGKYCTIIIPLEQQVLASPQSSIWSDMGSRLGLSGPLLANNSMELVKAASGENYGRIRKYVSDVTGFVNRENTSELQSFTLNLLKMTLGVCIPHACTTKQVVDHLITRHVPLLNVSYSEYFCRLPNDKPLSVADYIAVVVFSTLGVITIISTTYDVYNVLVLKRDQSQLKRIYQSFSLYTNTRRLVTFNKVPGALECVDGIRTISMLWVVVGHSYLMIMVGNIHNTRYLLEWVRKFTSTWLNTAPITVDTFFFLSGMLSVYSTVGKFSRDRFIKNIHFFYLLRLLRMFPLLAAVVLLQASFFHHASDGPLWISVAASVEYCKNFWWSALLHVQNFVNPNETCIAPSWYLSVDVQLYILSPLVMLWMFGKESIAWIAVTFFLLLSLIASSVYSFTYNFGAALDNPSRLNEFSDYIVIYYSNTLVRGSPFFIGMGYGYLLHLYRDKHLHISKIKIVLLWMLSMLVLMFCVVSIYPTMQTDHDLQIYDNILNSYMRALWACGLGWIIFACIKGYGGPVNWFLSLHMWKLPARLSYGVYLLHVPLIMTVQGGWVKTYYFSDHDSIFRFMSYTMMSFIVSFFLTIFIDSPFSALQKLLITAKVIPGVMPTNNLKSEKTNREHKYYKTNL